jgi:hypothetical protein
MSMNFSSARWRALGAVHGEPVDDQQVYAEDGQRPEGYPGIDSSAPIEKSARVYLKGSDTTIWRARS